MNTWINIKAIWKWWRMEPGLKAAAVLAADRAWTHPNTRYAGPELNLVNLANDINGERTRLRLEAFR